MYIEKPKYEVPQLCIIQIEAENIVRTSTGFDEGQSGLFV